VDDSLQDFQVLAEDVKSVGKPIFEAWLGYADTLSPVHSARQESIDSPGHIITANLANQYSSITQAHNSAPHQSLVEVPTSVKSMTTILPLSCSNIVGKKPCMSFLESSCISSRFCTFIYGSAFYSPTANGGECGRYLKHGAYSAVGKREITCLWRDGSAWVGHVYGRRACTHGGCCATQSMGGGW